MVTKGKNLQLMGCHKCGAVNIVDVNAQTTREAQSGVSSVGRFYAERCVYDLGARADSVDVLAAYYEWCAAARVKPVSSRAATDALVSLFGVERARSNGRRRLVNLRLLEAAPHR